MLTFALSERGIRRGLGESGTDTVFGRSFAALVIALAVVVDNRRPYLSELEYERVLAALVDYAASERDLRGFVPTKGWAHAPAHLADALGECVLSRYATTETARSATKALCSLVSRANEVFTGDEDERIAIAIGAAVEQRGLALDEVTTHVRAVAPSDSNRIARINRKLLARSLYFRLGRADELLRLAQWETDNASKRVIP
ncbi:MAG: DUF2785 domain-containing protein [Gaiellaceae bacterium MAG52_C11]|nr:DUF2785 domain-containing protein [Candidatus Gaiellasilicea maunaloa]